MKNHKLKNKGFTLIELLIAMAILSIVTFMVVQFMGSTLVAYRKNNRNLDVQTEAMRITNQMSDILMKASYIRVQGSGTDASTGATVTYDLVPDNYANYVKPATETTDRQVIYNASTFEIIDKNKNTYPFSGDLDIPDDNKNLKSYRCLKDISGTNVVYNYIVPQYIYVEYSDKETTVISSGGVTSETSNELLKYAVYKIDGEHIYYNQGNIVTTTPSNSDDINDTTNNRFIVAKNRLDAVIATGKGVLTDLIQVDGGNLKFQLSAESDGNTLYTKIIFENNGYTYETDLPINFRNTNVLTVRPQELYRYVPSGSGSGGTTGSTSTTGSGGTTGSTSTTGSGGTTGSTSTSGSGTGSEGEIIQSVGENADVNNSDASEVGSNETSDVTE